MRTVATAVDILRSVSGEPSVAEVAAGAATPQEHSPVAPGDEPGAAQAVYYSEAARARRLQLIRLSMEG